MGFLRFLFGALFALFALVAGLVTAAAIAIAGALLFAVRRLLRAAADRPPVQNGSARPRPVRSDEVIEVSATEVPADTSPLNR